jgi:hypothetical protein
MKKWTIGLVNYKSYIYFKYQLKILYEFNNPDDFDLIVIDNSEPLEIEKLIKVTNYYSNRFNNIKLIANQGYSNNFKLRTSSQHGEGLNMILNESNSNYLLVQDPDFFWVQENYLKILESELVSGVIAIGAPYGVSIKTGNPDFPSAFGCAYNLTIIKNDNLNFDTGTYEEKINEHKYPGWQMRAKYSNEKYVSFSQHISLLPFVFGDHAYLSIPRYYKYNNKVLCYHLFRGSFVGNSKDHVKNANNLFANKKIIDSRYLYSKYFYLVMKKQKIKIFKSLNLVDLLRNFVRLLRTRKIEDSASPYFYKKILKTLIKNKL